MIILYILGIILFVPILLLCCPVYLYISFNDALLIKVKVLFITFRAFPLKNKSNKKNLNNNKTKIEKKVVKENKKNKSLEIIKEKGPKGFLKIIKELLGIVINLAKQLFDCIKIDKLKLDAIIVGKDAADTALKYGKICSLSSTASLVLLKNAKRKHCKINLTPGFNVKKSQVNFISKVHFVPIRVIIILIFIFIKIVKNFYLSKLILNSRKDAI